MSVVKFVASNILPFLAAIGALLFISVHYPDFLESPSFRVGKLAVTVLAVLCLLIRGE